MTDYTLHSYFRSSCSARIRIALNLKSQAYDQVPVNLLKNEQASEQYKAINPSGTVPLLVCHNEDHHGFSIGQSISALEFLDEVHAQNPLLPSDPRSKALVRSLMFIIASDIQPVTNLRILRRVREFGITAEAWYQDLVPLGFTAYEAIVKDSAGKYSVGDNITMADICPVPAVWNAQRFGVDLTPFPTIRKVMEELEKHSARHPGGVWKSTRYPGKLEAKLIT